ncbi:hypothetical protein [Sphingomicrobium nitratireducens]|uniref:hypothetical protein n=1 Tax=Sphingomicrobium nitratireducens TaxID=2964666 RepID=UPI00223EF640|nr:hypothetical protein [Sphingomicrobium nitratireducens]
MSEGKTTAAERDEGLFRLALSAAVAGSLASLLNLLLYHRYPLLTPEVAMVTCVLLAASLAFAAVTSKVRFAVQALLAGLLVFLLADWAADEWKVAAAIGVVAAIAYFRMGKGLFRFLATAAVVIGLTSLFGLTERRDPATVTTRKVPAPDLARPLIVHIILDEQEGLRGMAAMDGAPGLAHEVDRRLRGAGFTTFANAHVRYHLSVNSMPSMLNFGLPDSGHGDSPDGGATGPARYLARLSDQGYPVHFVQSSYIDFCSDNPVASCRTYWRDDLAGLREVDLDATSRARAILVSIGRSMRSVLYTAALWDVYAVGRWKLVDASHRIQLVNRGDAGAINSLLELQRLQARIEAEGRPGEAYVAHLLLPHFPFALGRDCRVLPFGEWRISWKRHAVAERQRAYGEQVRCVMTQIERLYAAARRVAGDDVVMIVHGDHGSRIGRRLPSGGVRRASEQEKLHNFSTLFAVALPGQEPARREEIVAVETLLDRLSATRFASLEVVESETGATIEDKRANGARLDATSLDWTLEGTAASE